MTTKRIICEEEIPAKSFAMVAGYHYSEEKFLSLKAADAVNEGGGKVGTPSDNHGLAAESCICIIGTENYDGNYEIDSVEEDKIIITAAYKEETFDGTEKLYNSLFTLKAAAATDEDGGKVGLPIENHGLTAGRFVYIKGSQDYDGNHKIESVEEGKIVITTDYEVEEFEGTEQVCVIDNQCLVVAKPNADNLPFAKVVIVPDAVPAKTPGLAYIDGTHVVRRTGSEVVGDKVGTKKDGWKAKEDYRGIFLVEARQDDDLAVSLTRLHPTIFICNTKNGKKTIQALIIEDNVIKPIWSFWCGRYVTMGRDLAIDSFGGVIFATDIAGAPFGNYTLWKLSDQGEFLWGKQLSNNITWCVAVDADNYIYAAGEQGGTSYVYKFDEEGKEVWRSTDHPFTYIHGIAVDGDKNVYIIGGAHVCKLYPNGVKQWEADIKNVEDQDLIGWYVIVDSSGNVYAGATPLPDGEGCIGLFKFNGNGAKQWQKAYSLGMGRGMAVSGNYLYITGKDRTTGETVHKLNCSDGSKVWSRIDSELMAGMALDSSGNVYVAGGKSDIYPEATLIVYDNNGNLICTYDTRAWTQRIKVRL